MVEPAEQPAEAEQPADRRVAHSPPPTPTPTEVVRRNPHTAAGPHADWLDHLPLQGVAIGEARHLIDSADPPEGRRLLAAIVISAMSGPRRIVVATAASSDGGHREHAASGEVGDDSISPSDSTCCVCLEDIACGETQTVLRCAHRYHPACIREWVRRSRFCPMCKRVVDER